MPRPARGHFRQQDRATATQRHAQPSLHPHPRRPRHCYTVPRPRSGTAKPPSADSSDCRRWTSRPGEYLEWGLSPRPGVNRAQLRDNSRHRRGKDHVAGPSHRAKSGGLSAKRPAGGNNFINARAQMRFTSGGKLVQRGLNSRAAQRRWDEEHGGTTRRGQRQAPTRPKVSGGFQRQNCRSMEFLFRISIIKCFT